MITVVCHPDKSFLDAQLADRRIRLFGSQTENLAGIGNGIHDAFKRIDIPVSQNAYDLLSVAMAVMGTDEFVSRRNHSGDGFSRDLHVTIAVSRPAMWTSFANDLEATLGFLTGDNWQLFFISGGQGAPTLRERKAMRKHTEASKCDIVCLFSGGMDSLIGALQVLNDPCKTPLLVSRAARGDSRYQRDLLNLMPKAHRLSANDAPQNRRKSPWVKEESTRSRSIIFLALAACCADAIARHRSQKKVSLLIPENGVIAVNTPLTHRRVGAASTRTAHPRYLTGVQRLLDTFDIRASILNPFAFLTKGEMINQSPHRPALMSLIPKSVSCGNYKRFGQCGSCLPCIIRRAANHAAGVIEPTGTYRSEDLTKVVRTSTASNDLYALRQALRTHTPSSIPRWVLKAGPLCGQDPGKTFDTVNRGLIEIRKFLQHEGVPL